MTQLTHHLAIRHHSPQSNSLLQEYSEDSNSEPDVDLENQYYNSKALRAEDPVAALQSFQKVLELESSDKGEWGFRALKQMIKINFSLVGRYILLRSSPCDWDDGWYHSIWSIQGEHEEMMNRYRQLLTYIKSAVTRNYSEKSINSILDNISTSKQVLPLSDWSKFVSPDISQVRSWNYLLGCCILLALCCLFTSSAF